MNIPFYFTLDSSSDASRIGLFFDYSGGGQSNISLTQLASNPDVSGMPEDRLRFFGLLPQLHRSFFIDGLSITCNIPGADQQAMVEIGVWSSTNDNPVNLAPLFPTFACVNGGGIQKTFGRNESGIFVPLSAYDPSVKADQNFALRVTHGAVAGGPINLAGDISLFFLPE